MLDIFNKPYVIVIFSTTTDAVAAEAFVNNKGLSMRLIPIPGYIKAGCGLCLYGKIDLKTKILELLDKDLIKYENVLIKE